MGKVLWASAVALGGSRFVGLAEGGEGGQRGKRALLSGAQSYGVFEPLNPTILGEIMTSLIERGTQFIAAIATLAALVLAYMQVTDDRVPTSGAQTVELLREIRDRIDAGKIEFTSPEQRAAILEISGATAEAVYQMSRAAGAEDLPLLRITEEPIPIPFGGAAEVLLPNGLHVAVGATKSSSRSFVVVNGGSQLMSPGGIIPIPSAMGCHIAYLGRNPEGTGIFVRPVCAPG